MNMLEQIIRDYLQVVDLYYGTYLDGITAFAALLQEADDAEEKMRTQRRDLPPDSFSGAAFNYSKGAPRQADSVHLSGCTLGEYKERNKPGGRNHKTLGQMFVVTIYGYWEDHYRFALASALGQSDKNAIQSEVMGDIGYLRNAIVHHRGIGNKKLSEYKVFQWFNEGDEISLTPEQMEFVVNQLKNGLTDELRKLASALNPETTSDVRLVSKQFPRASQYHPEWVLASASGGANSLWLAEWLMSALKLRPGMRVLDLGCGRASSSIFLRREFGVQVWATDLWFSAAENIQRIRDAGVEDDVFPLHADARSLPFAPGFFDAIVGIDSFYYFGSDDLYLNYLAQFVKPGGPIGIAGAGLVREIEGEVPEHLRAWWTQDLWSLHSAAWWRRHWERTGIVHVELAETMPDGWRLWLDWHRAVAPDNATEIKAIEEDQGRFIGYARVVGRRRGEAKLEEYCWPDTLRSLPQQYTKKPLLRSQES